jgi:hypothetical protein
VVVLKTGTETFWYIFQQTHTWNTAALKTDAVRQCTWIEASFYITAWLTNPLTHTASLLLSTGKVTLPFENSVKELTLPHDYRKSLALTFPWFNTLWFSFVGSLKDKANKTNLHTLEEHLPRNFNNFWRRTPQSKQQRLLQLYQAHSVRRTILSASDVALMSFCETS